MKPLGDILKKKMVEATVDPSGWMIDNSVADFLLMPHAGITYMCMFAYAFVHGEKKQKVIATKRNVRRIIVKG